MKRKKIFTALTVIFELIIFILGLILTINYNQTLVIGLPMIILSIFLLIFIIVGYNKMVRYKNKVSESLSLIDIHLKLRFDLIPNLVEVVKKYTEHEKELLEEVVRLRTIASTTTDEKEKLEYANKLVPQMKNLIMVAENYPELKSDTLYKSLMEQLIDIEERLVSARRIYDSNINIYNTSIQVFPRNILAYMFEFKKEELFKIDACERLNINIKLEN